MKHNFRNVSLANNTRIINKKKRFGRTRTLSHQQNHNNINCGDEWNRTTYTWIFSPMLYR